MKTEDLSWWEWLTLTPTALKFRGVDPELRFRETGHTQALSPRWARTVGMWRLNTSMEIREVAGVTDNAVRVFKHKHTLITREPSDPARPRLWVAEHVARTVDGLVSREGFGRAEYRAALDHGVLPIEAKLYHTGYREMLIKSKLVPVKYAEIDSATAREALWLEHGCFDAFEEKP